MRLNARPLKNVIDVNHFQYANELYVGGYAGESEAANIYVQLIDLDQDNLRYIPTAGTTLTVTFSALEDEDSLDLALSQPFAGDASIWVAAVPAGSNIRSGNLIFTMVEGGVTRTFVMKNGLVVEFADAGGC